MKPVKEKDLRDLKVKIIECKRQYITKAMEFRRRMVEEKKRAVNLRKKKKLQRNCSYGSNYWH